MDPTIAVLLMIAVLFFLIVVETPIAFALALSGVLGLSILGSANLASAQLGGSSLESVASFGLAVIPMYILMGMFAVHGHMAEQLYAFGSVVFRRVPGGLGVGTVAACAAFGAVTGSSVAAGATMGRISIDEMIAHGYDKKMAAGVVAAAGTLGGLIPPSIIMVIYSIITGESTGKMLIAGIVPGILTAAAYATYIIVRESLRRNRALVPAAHDSLSGGVVESHAPAPAPAVGPGRAGSLAGAQFPLRGLVEVGILFTIVIGGIYSGYFTPTESGAVGALAALLIMLYEVRKEGVRLTFRRLAGALSESAGTTSMIFAILIGSAVFTVALVASRAPQDLVQYIVGLDVPPKVIVAIMILLLLPMGMFLESISIMVIAMPLMYPVVTSLGFDGVWFGVLVVLAVEIGLITPPVGVSCFVVASTSKAITVEDTFRGVAPFVLMETVVLGLLFFFPEVVLALPNAVG